MNENPKGQPVPMMVRPAPLPASARHAQALAEITKMEEDLRSTQQQVVELQRSLTQANDRVAMLDAQMQHEREQKEIFQRKLVQLASAMAGIGALTHKAEDVMRQVEQVEKK